VLLQGVADCCIEEDGMLTVIDYKTDYIPPEGPAEAAAATRSRSGLCGRPRGAIRKPVREGVLVFLRTGDTVSVPVE
jgi:hypothetical protein